MRRVIVPCVVWLQGIGIPERETSVYIGRARSPGDASTWRGHAAQYSAF